MTLGTDATKTERRLWLTVWPGENDRAELAVSLREPDAHGALAVIRAVGQVTPDTAVRLDVEGEEGPTGWTPVLVAEADGTRTLVRIVDWVRSAARPGVGYLTTTGELATTKAAAFNFNTGKRAGIFSGATGANGIATVAFAPAFDKAPAQVPPFAVPNLLAGPVKAEIVPGSLTKSGCQVRVTTSALLTGVVTLLAGAAVNVFAIES